MGNWVYVLRGWGSRTNKGIFHNNQKYTYHVSQTAVNDDTVEHTQNKIKKDEEIKVNVINGGNNYRRWRKLYLSFNFCPASNRWMSAGKRIIIPSPSSIVVYTTGNLSASSSPSSRSTAKSTPKEARVLAVKKMSKQLFRVIYQLKHPAATVYINNVVCRTVTVEI